MDPVAALTARLDAFEKANAAAVSKAASPPPPAPATPAVVVDEAGAGASPTPAAKLAADLADARRKVTDFESFTTAQRELIGDEFSIRRDAAIEMVQALQDKVDEAALGEGSLAPLNRAKREVEAKGKTAASHQREVEEAREVQKKFEIHVATLTSRAAESAKEHREAQARMEALRAQAGVAATAAASASDQDGAAGGLKDKRIASLVQQVADLTNICSKVLPLLKSFESARALFEAAHASGSMEQAAKAFALFPAKGEAAPAAANYSSAGFDDPDPDLVLPDANARKALLADIPDGAPARKKTAVAGAAEAVTSCS